MRDLAAAALLASSGAGVACSPASAPRSTDADSTDVQRFDELPRGERLAYMKNVVMPRMAELFQTLDPERYDDMKCATCHGSGARQGHFRMPSPDLPALDPTDGFAEHRRHSPEVTAFMMEEVVPQMARLLGESPYDPATGRGFGCFDCHEKK